MKTALMMVLATLVLAACNSGRPAEKQIESDPIRLGTISMDAIYAAEGAFMEHGMTAIEPIMRRMEAALIMWPEKALPNDRINACHLALLKAAKYWSSVRARSGLQMDQSATDDRDMCRLAVDYKFDSVRIHATWDLLLKER